jgi:hypothetical protein
VKQESRIAKMAAAAGVEMAEVRARAQRLLAADSDREARLRDLAERVAAKDYAVEGTAIVEAALAGDERVLDSRERVGETPDILRDL